MSKILVTGGGGFLGKALVQRLVKQGKQVRVLGRRNYPDLEQLGVELVTADIQDQAVVMQACKDVDTVFHVAAKVGIWGAYKQFYATNVLGSKNMLAACHQQGVEKLVYTSSPSVTYDGTDQVNVDETAPYPQKHLCAYAATKAEAEQLILAASGTHGLLTAALRPHLIWGPGDTNLIPRLVEKGKAGRLIQVGDGENLVDITYIDNAVDAHLQAAQRLEPGSPVAGQAYFISQGEPVKLWDWVNQVLTGLGINPVQKQISYRTAYFLGAACEAVYTVLRLKNEPPMTRFLASQLAKPHYFNLEKAKRELGYVPAVGSDEGITKLLASYQ